MYWTSELTGRIWRARLDGSGVELFLVTPDRPRGICVDTVRGYLYWVEPIAGAVARTPIEPAPTREVVVGALVFPVAIAVDPHEGRIYWVDRGTDLVQRARLDGTAVETVVANAQALTSGVALDLVNRRLYWADERPNTVYRANLDGSDPHTVLRSDSINAVGMAIDTLNGRLYWTNHAFPFQAVQRADLDGTNVETVMPNLRDPQGIAIDSATAKVYWVDASWEIIQRADLDGTNAEDLLSHSRVGWGHALDLRGGRMYWFEIDARDVWRIRGANLDGSDTRDVVPIASGFTTFMAIDSAGGRLYWTSSSYFSGSIFRVNMDGSGVEMLADSDQDSPRGIALDAANQRMYWANDHYGYHASLLVANLDGAQPKVIGDVIVYCQSESLAIDRRLGLLFRCLWRENRAVIQRVRLATLEFTDVVTSDSERYVAVDPVHEMIYWGARDGIRRATYDGAMQELVVPDVRTDGALAIDPRDPGDFDANAVVGLEDFAEFQTCFTGTMGPAIASACMFFDAPPADHDLDLEDFAAFWGAWVGRR
ncbi:MAG: PQQ-binding-like beta-propeller repeat protein [Planctomycetes bacterium]|nr:PQQ-binding-like beta-propeller repeat protein [Planctomycetota bacterium]